MASDEGMRVSQTSDSLPLVTELQRVVHVLGVHLEAMLSDLKLTQGEVHVLSLLGHAGTLSVAHLQRGVRHRPSTLTGILDRLEGKGLVQRRINEVDRRSNLIELTPDGRIAADRVLQAMSAIEEDLARHRSRLDIDTARSVLTDLVARL